MTIKQQISKYAIALIRSKENTVEYFEYNCFCFEIEKSNILYFTTFCLFFCCVKIKPNAREQLNSCMANIYAG